MSRNLCSIKCYYCDGIPMPMNKATSVVLEEEPRYITEEEAGFYYREYKRLIVANAKCELCEAKYLAWVDESHREYPENILNNYKKCFPGLYQPEPRRITEDDRESGINFIDLSFRKAFNDEPADEDLPVYNVEAEVTYKRTLIERKKDKK